MLNRKRIIGTGLAAVLLLVGGVLAQPATPARGTSFRPPPGALIAPGEAPDLFLLYTGDVLGYVDACG